MNILVTFEAKEEDRRVIEAAAPGHSFTYGHRSEITHDDLLDKDIIIGNVPEKLLCDLPRLKWIQLDSAGSDTYAPLPLFKGEGAPVLTNASGGYGVTISEYMIGSIIVLLRHFQVYRDQMKEHRWERVELPEVIFGKKALVLGLGDIGSNFARRMKALGAHVTAIRRSAGICPDYVDAVYPIDELPKLLPEMDIVASCLPNSPQTTKIINKDTLALMKKTAIFVNVGRGTAVDCDALAEALNAGTIGGAALDVTDPEPLPEDHPLWDCRNALVTPHVAGLFYQREPYERILKLSAENLAAFLAGKPLKSVVDINTGYRKL